MRVSVKGISVRVISVGGSVGEKPVELLDNFGSDLPLLEVLGDEGMA